MYVMYVTLMYVIEHIRHAHSHQTTKTRGSIMSYNQVAWLWNAFFKRYLSHLMNPESVILWFDLHLSGMSGIWYHSTWELHTKRKKWFLSLPLLLIQVRHRRVRPVEMGTQSRVSECVLQCQITPSQQPPPPRHLLSGSSVNRYPSSYCFGTQFVRRGEGLILKLLKCKGVRPDSSQDISTELILRIQTHK